MVDYQYRDNPFYHSQQCSREYQDQNLAQFILLTSMRKLDQGRRSRAGIQLERGLLIAVTAIKARQSLWEQELKLRKLYHQPVNTPETYTPICTPVSPEKVHTASENVKKHLTITIPVSEPSTSFVTHFTPEASSMFMELEKTDTSNDSQDDSVLEEDSFSDQSSTDEDLLPDEAMDKMVYSTICESEENERWRFHTDDFDESTLVTSNDQWSKIAVEPMSLLEIHTSDSISNSQSKSSHQRKRRLTYTMDETNPDPFLTSSNTSLNP